jgi:hypothetical protein
MNNDKDQHHDNSQPRHAEQNHQQIHPVPQQEALHYSGGWINHGMQMLPFNQLQ